MSRHHAAFLFLLTPVPPIMTAATRFHPLVSDLLELLALILRGLPVFASEIARKRRLKNCLCLTSPRPTHFCPPPAPTMTAARCPHPVVSDSNCATRYESARPAYFPEAMCEKMFVPHHCRAPATPFHTPLHRP